MATVQSLEAERQRLLETRARLADAYQSGDESLLPEIRLINQELRAVVLAIEELQNARPVESTGQTVINAQQASDSGADTQAPDRAPSVIDASGTVTQQRGLTVPSNAESSNPAPATSTASPPKLPSGTVTAGDTSAPAPAGSSSPRPPTQSSVSSGAQFSPDENNNLVSYIYRATRVISNFRQGKFTQEIEGAQVFFTIPPRPGKDQNSGITGITGSEAIRTEDGRVSNIRRNTETGELYVGTPGVTYATNADQNYSYSGAVPTGQPPEQSRVTSAQSATSATADENPPNTSPLTSSPPTSGTTNIQTVPVVGQQPTNIGTTATDNTQQGSREY
jgi:hypothetical protein